MSASLSIRLFQWPGTILSHQVLKTFHLEIEISLELHAFSGNRQVLLLRLKLKLMPALPKVLCQKMNHRRLRCDACQVRAYLFQIMLKIGRGEDIPKSFGSYHRCR
jgi:hypothetical protein